MVYFLWCDSTCHWSPRSLDLHPLWLFLNLRWQLPCFININWDKLHQNKSLITQQWLLMVYGWVKNTNSLWGKITSVFRSLFSLYYPEGFLATTLWFTKTFQSVSATLVLNTSPTRNKYLEPKNEHSPSQRRRWIISLSAKSPLVNTELFTCNLPKVQSSASSHWKLTLRRQHSCNLLSVGIA